MSKYDNLDARRQLEQVITKDLKDALSKRGFEVKHSGTKDNSAPGGIADIIFQNKRYIISVEVTKTTKSSQDREFQAIRDHLSELKKDNATQKCFCLFVSPQTSKRTIESIKVHNHQRHNEKKLDMLIFPMDFETFELWITKLKEAEADLYPFEEFINLFDKYTEFIDDLRIRKLLVKNIFPQDHELDDNIRKQETEHDEKTLESLIKDLARIEDYMRQNGIATSQNAIDNLIYLVFLKLYEEKRQRDKLENRLRSVEVFENYRNNLDEQTRKQKRAIHKLFSDVKKEGEFIKSKMFTENDSLVDSLNDDFIKDKIIPIFNQYNFLGTKLDALGAVYEVLALRADKDVKVGQFFTPENVVKFMIKLADMGYDNMVLDPASGTGRFLIHSMFEMQHKLDRTEVRNKEDLSKNIREHQCFGSDIDVRIAKIAKMNMWVHGDGKSNIFGGREYNGLLLHKKGFNGHKSFDNAFDVVLTNPPLGELDYQVIPFADEPEEKSPESELKHMLEKRARMPILPFKNLTEEKLTMVNERIAVYDKDLSDLNLQLKQSDLTGKELQAIKNKIKSKIKVIDNNKDLAKTLDAKIRTGKIDYEITGNKMKGGAMFLAAIWHYLKNNANPDEKPEWRGGKMLIILDEGVLNTDDYTDVRNFIKEHFYIKAVISLTRDTFIPISKTATKTSILYAVKKTDKLAVQKEPVFFAHVEKVGLDTKAKVCPNDFDLVLDKYLEFKKAIINSYSGLEFRKEKFISQMPKHEIL